MLGKQSTIEFTAPSAPILFYVPFTPLSASHHHLLITLFRTLDSLQIALYLSLGFLYTKRLLKYSDYWRLIPCTSGSQNC